ncbi:MAG: hypothetical protein K8S62_08370 [Candidatus Sabulitectum sp.]|nr:hypothetical protein [Candidatus Sabulitectum sp.]
MIQFREKLRNRYEEVRVYSTGRSCPTVLPEGLALILGRGVPDWMNTWSHIFPIDRVRYSKAKAEAVLPPDTISSQMTVVLARMVINSVEEPVSC